MQFVILIFLRHVIDTKDEARDGNLNNIKAMFSIQAHPMKLLDLLNSNIRST
jgi:hypothetical protein